MDINSLNLKCKKILAISLTLIGLFGFINGCYETLIWNILLYYSCAFTFYMTLFTDANSLASKYVITIMTAVTLYAMVMPILTVIFRTPLFTDDTFPITLTYIAIAILVIGILISLFYFSCKTFRDYKYSLPIVLSFYIVGLLIINFIPIVYNVVIDYI